MKSTVLAFLLFLLVCAFAAPSRAAIPVNRISGDLLGLDLSVYVAGKPISLILIEKDFQRLRVLRHDGRLQVVAEYFAATGENFGAKLAEGDSKTPEGIYFIIKRYTDTKVTVFGTRAFHLNYPNIFDSNDGKGGNGIYIHGTNKELRSNSTNGCITLNNGDLDGLSSFLNVGTTPVIIVSSLQKLKTGKGVYPDLTRENYSLAKELLAPNSIRDGGFVSLFLIRVNGQTVVAGDYREPVSAKRQNFVAAYLDVTQENGWYAMKRIPAGPAESEPAQVAEQTEQPEAQDGGQRADDWNDIWKPRQEDIYLSWYRDSIQDDIDVAVEEPEMPPINQTDNRIIYGLFLLATCLSIGSALIFIRSQARRMKKSIEFGSGDPLPPGLRADELIGRLRQVEALQGDIQRANETLQMLQEYVDEEAQGMDTQDLQARIDELESELAGKRGEIDQLATEKAAMKLKGITHLSGQVEELSSMGRELNLAQEQLTEARKDLGRLPVLEEMVSSQKSEIQQLFAEKASMKLQLSDSQDQQGLMERLREKANTLEEALEAEEDRRRALEKQVGAVGEEAAAELAVSRAEAKELKDEIAALREAADKSGIEEELVAARNELAALKESLNAEQERSAEVSQSLARFSEMEQELGWRSAQVERLIAEKASLQEERGQSELEEELTEARSLLAASRHALQVEQDKTAMLTTELARISELEEMLLARQVEVTKLVNDIEAMQENAEAERFERMDSLQAQLDSLRQELGEERDERRLAQQLAQERMDETRVMEAEIEQLKRDLATAQHERQPVADSHIAALPEPFAHAVLAEETPAPVMEELVEPEVLSGSIDHEVSLPIHEAPQPSRERPVAVEPPQPEKKSADWVTGTNLLPGDILQGWINS